MSRPTRQLPALLTRRSTRALEARRWLDGFLAPMAYEGVARINGRIDVFALAGTLGQGLLAEAWHQVDGRPGVNRVQTSAWVIRAGLGNAFLVEIELHSWDAGTEALITGDRHWLEVPRRRMYAERDRRTAAIGEELDTFTVHAMPIDSVPDMRAGLSADQVRRLAERFRPGLLDVPGPMSWEAFTDRLAAGIPKMAGESFLILSLPDDGAGSRGYIQFAHWAKDDGATTALRVEAAGSRNLPDTRQLTPAQEERLEALAWQRPAADEKAQNFLHEWSMPAPVAEVAALVVRTFREVYGVGEPTALRSRYASFEGTDVDDLDLGLEPEERSPRPPSKPQRRPPASSLTPVVEEGIRRWMGVERLARDADGDYPIPIGSALVFVHVDEGPLPMIAVFSSVLSGVEGTPALFVALNDINHRIRFARVFWISGTILVAMELPSVDVTADQIAFACVQLGSLADHLDDVLHGRFGGGFAFDGRSTLVN